MAKQNKQGLVSQLKKQQTWFRTVAMNHAAMNILLILAYCSASPIHRVFTITNKTAESLLNFSPSNYHLVPPLDHLLYASA